MMKAVIFGENPEKGITHGFIHRECFVCQGWGHDVMNCPVRKEATQTFKRSDLGNEWGMVKDILWYHELNELPEFKKWQEAKNS